MNHLLFPNLGSSLLVLLIFVHLGVEPGFAEFKPPLRRKSRASLSFSPEDILKVGSLLGALLDGHGLGLLGLQQLVHVLLVHLKHSNSIQ